MLRNYLWATIDTMFRVLYLLAVISLVFTGCGNNTNSNNSKGATQHTATANAGNWYKRYTGTVAGQQVVVNLYFGGDSGDAGTISITGNYYYSGKSQLIDLSADGRKGNELHLTEHVQAERDVDENKQYPEWAIAIEKSGIKGKWYSGDRKKVQDIALHENYDGAYRFDVLDSSDSVTVEGREAKYEMSTQYEFLVPSAMMDKGDADFITRSLLHEINDSPTMNNFNDFIMFNNQSRFAEYKNTIAELIKDSIESESNNWYSAIISQCIYNDKYLLVYSIHRDAYSGGAHGSSESTYICLDVKEKKVWRLKDILHMDSTKLSALLEQEIRKTFKIKPGAPLNESLLVDAIPVTGNVIISDAGLTFFYNQYEIASYADGQLAFFLSYGQLSSMLQPAFKKRIGL